MSAPLHPPISSTPSTTASAGPRSRAISSLGRSRHRASTAIASAHADTASAHGTAIASAHVGTDQPRSEIWAVCCSLWPALVALALATCGIATDALAAPSPDVGSTRARTAATTTDPTPTPRSSTHAGDASDSADEAIDDPLDQIDPALASQVHGPPIAEVLAAAYAAAGIERAAARNRTWIRRARLGGLVPWMTVRVGRDVSWQNDDPTIDRGMAIEVRATWRLDRLVFDGRELQVATIEAARRRERRRLGRLVIRTYFTWIRARVRAAGHPATRSAVIAVDEAAAELDALTDGWFSEGLGSSRRTASENRTPDP